MVQLTSYTQDELHGGKRKTIRCIAFINSPVFVVNVFYNKMCIFCIIEQREAVAFICRCCKNNFIKLNSSIHNYLSTSGSFRLGEVKIKTCLNFL